MNGKRSERTHKGTKENGHQPQMTSSGNGTHPGACRPPPCCAHASSVKRTENAARKRTQARRLMGIDLQDFRGKFCWSSWDSTANADRRPEKQTPAQSKSTDRSERMHKSSKGAGHRPGKTSEGFQRSRAANGSHVICTTRHLSKMVQRAQRNNRKT